ncbi:hypothetical protein ACMA1D_16930 [Streptomyces sp. 796.1]
MRVVRYCVLSKKVLVMATACAAVGGVLGVAPTARAAVGERFEVGVPSDVRAAGEGELAADPCKRQNYRKVVHIFYRGPEKVLLRCGTKSWGYRHMVERGRWSTSFKNKIDDTLWKGVQTSPGVYHRYRIPAGCHRPIKNFKVVFNQGPYGGDEGKTSPQGIITAVQENTLTAVSEKGAGGKC